MPNQTGVLIDTSVWIEFLRGQNQGLIGRIRELILAREARLCGVVLAELFSGVKSRSGRDALREALEAVEYLEVSKDTWALAGEISSELRGQGIKVPLTDLVVAALAIKNDCELFSFDSQFDHIPNLKRFRI